MNTKKPVVNNLFTISLQPFDLPKGINGVKGLITRSKRKDDLL